MLTRLSIRDIVLIEALDLDFQENFSVLTGETGAGKSILLEALALALGARAESALVRKGAQVGSVIAVFEPLASHPIWQKLQGEGIPFESEIIFKRQVTADGKSKASINDMPLTAALMRQLGANLVEIHGQHDDRALLDSQTHRSLLDAYGGFEALALEVSNAYQTLKETQIKIEEHEKELLALQKEQDWLAHAAAELQKLNPQPNEEEKLADERANMQKFEKNASLLSESLTVLSGSTPLVPELAALSRQLSRRSQDWPQVLEPAVEAIDKALDELANAEQILQRGLDSVEYNPQHLENIEERLFALRAAARKYQTTVEALPTLAQKYASDLQTIEGSQNHLKQLQQLLVQNQNYYQQLAQKLSIARHETAEILNQAVMAELPDLKLAQAKFFTQIETDTNRQAQSGFDVVQFMVQTNPGSSAGAMAKVASGGELSRFLLSLKVALADKGSAPTLIFDEIDTGVGGAVAQAMGERLSRLAQKVQVLSVTHAPQVAACAHHHYLIEKSSQNDKTTTKVILLTQSEKHEEVARMLSGNEITQEARAAAKRLMGV